VSSIVLTGAVVSKLLTTNGVPASVGSMPASAATPPTATVATGSPDITFSAPVTLPAGTKLQFSTQPGVTYTLMNAITAGTAGVLTSAYTGGTGGVAAVLNQTPVLVLTSPGATDLTQPTQLSVVSIAGEKTLLTASPLGILPGTTPILTAQNFSELHLVGSNRQPVQLAAIPASMLVP